MDSYEESLQSTISKGLTAAETEKAKLDAQENAAEQTLFYAQGASITAQEKLDAVTKDYNTALAINNAGVDNDNLATNLNATTIEANKKTASAVTNMATAANNIEIATKAIVTLASDIGSANTVAQAGRYGSDVAHSVSTAYSAINEVAYSAEDISNDAMMNSTSVAEIISKEVMTESAKTKNDIEELLKVTTAEFDKITATQSADTKVLNSANKKEKAAEGLLRDAEREQRGIDDSVSTTINALNYSLSVTVNTMQSISVGFTKFINPDPVATPNSKSTQYLTDSKAPINYYIVFVKASKSALFTVSSAEAAFSTKPDAFTRVEPGIYNSSTNKISPMNLINIGTTSQITPITVDEANVDSDGDSLKSGNEYVLFLYIELPPKYKRLIATYTDVVSAASESFTLATSIPIPTELDPNTTNPPTPKNSTQDTTNQTSTQSNDPTKSFTFSVKTSADMIKKTQYRLICVPTAPKYVNGFYGGKDIRDTVLFNLNTALQVSSANYTIAESNSDLPHPPEDKTVPANSPEARNLPKGDPSQDPTSTDVKYTVSIDSETTTDCFGNTIVPDRQYSIYILGVTNELAPQYAPMLSPSLRNENIFI